MALRWTALDPGDTLFESVILLDKASNWEEFRNALRYWDTPSQNFVYADTEGNIGYQTPGKQNEKLTTKFGLLGGLYYRAIK